VACSPPAELLAGGPDADRVLYGGDWPTSDPAGALDAVRLLAFTDR
jgi:hypothetical protein